MKEYKREIRYFSIMHWEEQQEYLQLRHRQGWAFDRFTAPFIYHFTRCEPEEMVYQLDYNQEGLHHKEDYIQMFADCGWEYIQDCMGYCYFRKPKANMETQEDGIFCDDASRLDLILRIFRGRMIPLLVVLAVVILPQLYLHRHLTTSVDIGVTVLYSSVLVLYAVVFARFWRKLKEYRSTLDS